MTEKPVYPDLMIESMNITNDNGRTTTSNDLTTIFILSNDLAKQIKEQAMDTIEHLINFAP
jgi:hypothetical protein